MTKKFFLNDETVHRFGYAKREWISHFNYDHVTVNFLAFHHTEYFWNDNKKKVAVLSKPLTNYPIAGDYVSRVCHKLTAFSHRRVNNDGVALAVTGRQ